MTRFDKREQLALLWVLAKWSLLGSWIGLLSGSASALFLLALDRATRARVAHPWALWLLPVAGLLVGLVYDRYGREVEGGNNLLLDRIHSPAAAIPFRLVPLILGSTVVTHLFGGSAGREGTAVQMGGTLANLATGPLRLSAEDHRLTIMAGISGGFGSVFGTPLAGAVFGLEVLAVGRVGYDALVPCFVASVVGDLVCRAWGVQHHDYLLHSAPSLTPGLWLALLVAGLAFGLTSLVFAELTGALSRFAKARIATPWLRPCWGGLAVVGLTALVGSHDYLGLSLPLIERSFTPHGVALGAFALKLLFTAVTLGAGFKGGEVTPLFCIGATLGATLARLTGQPTDLLAACGFVAVFAGAANTPLSCVLMGIELFGAPVAVPVAAACFLSYITSGHRGIYASQRIATPKSMAVKVPAGTALRDARHGGLQVHLSRALFRHVLQRRRSPATTSDANPVAPEQRD